MDVINPGHKFKNRFNDLLNQYPNVNVRSMGFPDDWRGEPLWESILQH